MTTGPATPKLKKQLSMSGALAFGLAYMAPGVVLSIFGVISAASGGAAPTAYAVATVAMAFTALSYAKLAKAIPSAGSAYVYARRLLDSRVGFLVGWSVLLDYLFLPSLAWLFMGTFFNAQFPFLPAWAWLLITAAATTLVNVVGVAVADRVNRVLLAVAVLMVVLFAAACVYHILKSGSGHNLTAPLWNSDTSIRHISTAAAIAAYAFLGFEAISTLAEETRDPQRSIPRAIILAIVAGGGFFVIVSYLAQLAIPGGDLGDAAYYDIAKMIGGQTFANTINTMYIIGGFASCMAIQAATARLMYVMGRDGIFPRRLFGHLSGRFRTPTFNLVAIGLSSVIALWSSIERASSFINFGAFMAFIAVNLCVVAHYVRQYRQGVSLPVMGYVVAPVLGAAICLYLVVHLESIAIWIGLGWLTAGVVYLTVLTKGFRRPPPQMPLADVQEPAQIGGIAESYPRTTT
jgi:amino acid transporter